MNRRLLRLLALSSALAFPAALAGASSRIELSGGWPKGATQTVATEIPVAPVRPLAPGEILVLGPIASPLSAPALALPEIRPPASRAAVVSDAVDTVVVAAPSAPASPPTEAPRPPAAGTAWDSYRTGNVVRIALPRN